VPGARPLAEDGVRYARTSGSGWRLAYALVLLGQVVHRQDEPANAVAMHEEALALFEAEGERWGRAYAAASLASLHERRPSVARVAALSGVRLYWDIGDRGALAGALEYLALQGERERPEAQVGLLAAAHALRASLGIALPLGERADVERAIAQVRTNLGPARFRAIWAEGEAASLEQVVERTLHGEHMRRRSSAAAGAGRGRAPAEALTAREREVARLLAREYSDRQIAHALTITEGTAGLHVHHILAKLGLRSRAQVADWAVAEGLVESEPV
jgi:non-specific serine/threonine protein kinase